MLALVCLFDCLFDCLIVCLIDYWGGFVRWGGLLFSNSSTPSSTPSSSSSSSFGWLVLVWFFFVSLFVSPQRLYMSSCSSTP